MPLLSYPLVAWGSPADINVWTDIGTPVITSSVADPFGGTGAYTVNDNDAGVSEGKLVSTGAITGTLVTLGVCMKAGTATSSSVQFRDTTAGAYTIQATTVWSGAVPGTPTMGSGSYVGQISLGNGWYLLIFTCAWTTGNVGRVEVYGASNSAATIGTTSYYLRNMVPFSYVERAVSFALPRDGSSFRQGPSGTEESWIMGPDEILACTARWIPFSPRSDPTVQAGFRGENEYAGVNCGYKAMIEAGWQRNTMLWVPDRAACSTYQSGYLVEPEAQDIGLEANGPFRTFPLRFRGTSPFTAD